MRSLRLACPFSSSTGTPTLVSSPVPTQQHLVDGYRGPDMLPCARRLVTMNAIPPRHRLASSCTPQICGYISGSVPQRRPSAHSLDAPLTDVSPTHGRYEKQHPQPPLHVNPGARAIPQRHPLPIAENRTEAVLRFGQHEGPPWDRMEGASRSQERVSRFDEE